MYAQPLIDSIKANNRTMTEEMIESMTENDNETEEYVAKFMSNLERRTKQYHIDNEGKAEKTAFYYVVRNTLWDTFAGEYLVAAMFSFVSECSSIGYTMFLVVLIGFLKDKDVEAYWGYIYLLIFALMMLLGGICRN